jgi:hypothetical protein
MSTDNTQPFAGLSVQAVADATGLSRATIYQAAEHQSLGVPAHFTYQHGTVVYSAAGLCRLVEGLDQLGQSLASKVLAARLTMERQRAATAAGVTSPDTARSELRRWDIAHELQQEAAAA